ncbi:MAG: TetR family transcriptional regulator [Acidimicrobiales bacterium]
MSSLSRETGPAGGLRERKKAKTRAAIQHEALRLFREQGYEATTIEQIAATVEIAPSTFFRYFHAKEDLVLSDEYDALIIEAFCAEPVDVGPLQAIRNAIRVVFGGVSDDDMSDMRERAELALTVPELRAGMFDNFAQTIRMVTDLTAERLEQPAGDFAVYAMAGAVLGVMTSAEVYWLENPGSDLVALLDEALACLESGLSL